MELLLKWIRGTLGEPGDFPYQSMHITTIIIFAICLIMLIVVAKSNTSKKKTILKLIALFQLSFEIIWRLIYYFINDETLISLYPAYPCNINAIIVSIVCLMNDTKGKKMFYLISFIGGIVTMFVPNGIFSRTVFIFPILKSILQHTGIIFIPVFEYFAGYYKTSVKDYPLIIVGALIDIINSGLIAPSLGLEGDFLFLDMGLPFVIDGVNQFYPMFFFIMICLFIISIIINVPEFINIIKKR